MQVPALLYHGGRADVPERGGHQGPLSKSARRWCRAYFDAVSTWMVRHSKMHDSIREYGDDVRFTWGLDGLRDIRSLGPWAEVRRGRVLNQELRRWGWSKDLIPGMAKGQDAALRHTATNKI